MLERLGKVRVGVLRGGINKNHQTSLVEGGKMISYIIETLPHKAKALDIFIDKDGSWNFQGLPILPMDLIHKVDVLWDTTSPAVSQVLEGHIPLFKIPHFAKAMTTSKALLREHMKSVGIKMPMHIILTPYQEDIDGSLDTYVIKKAREVHAKFGAPWIAKAFKEDSNVAIHVAKTFPELMNAIEDLAKHKTSILVEELIPGKKGGVHTIAGFRGENLYHMLPYEIRKNGIEPVGNFSDSDNERLYSLSENIYNNLGAGIYLHFNFVITRRGEIYVTEISFLPDFERTSALSDSAKTVGSNSEEVFDHMIVKALSF